LRRDAHRKPDPPRWPPCRRRHPSSTRPLVAPRDALPSRGRVLRRDGKRRTGGPAMLISPRSCSSGRSPPTSCRVLRPRLVAGRPRRGVHGVAAAGIGFNVQTMARNGSYSRSVGNRLAAWTLDLLGVAVLLALQAQRPPPPLHNVSGVDDDLQAEPFLRLEPSSALLVPPFQHFYIWLSTRHPAEVAVVRRLPALAVARIGDQPIPRRRMALTDSSSARRSSSRGARAPVLAPSSRHGPSRVRLHLPRRRHDDGDRLPARHCLEKRSSRRGRGERAPAALWSEHSSRPRWTSARRAAC